MKKMTTKMQRFVAEYPLQKFNATQAAIEAGYSAKTARTIGPRLLQNVVVQEALTKSMAKYLKKAEVTEDHIIHELGLLGFSNLGDYINLTSGQIDIEHMPEERTMPWNHIPSPRGTLLGQVRKP